MPANMPANMPAYMSSFSEAKKIINGQLIQDIAVKTEYNGKTLHVDKMDNNTFSHNVIQDKDLAKLMKKSANKRGLWEQLTKDYLGDHRKHKQSKHKTKKKKKQSRKKTKKQRF
jgi:hypothetical protein